MFFLMVFSLFRMFLQKKQIKMEIWVAALYNFLCQFVIWLSRVFLIYGGPQVSRQKKKAPGKIKMLAAKKKLFTANEKNSR